MPRSRRIAAVVLVTFSVGCQQGLHGPLGQSRSQACPVVPLCGGVGNHGRADDEIARIHRLLEETEKGVKGWREGRVDVEDDLMMRAALLMDLAAIDLSRRKDLLDEAVQEIELRESAVPGYDGAAFRLRVRMVRDLVCARMATVAK